MPALTSVFRIPLWSQPIDDPAETFHDADMLAHGSGIVAFSSKGRVCGFDEVGGKRRWCAGRGSAPVFNAGEFAFVGPDGIVRAVDAATGRPRWSYLFPAVPRRELSAPHPPFPVAQSVWPAGSDFIVTRRDENARFNLNYGELDPSGRPLWKTRVETFGMGPRVAVPGGFLQQSASFQYIVRLGPRGGWGASFEGDVLGVCGSSVIVEVEAWGEVVEHILVREIHVVNARDGTVRESYRFMPDWDANVALLDKNALPDSASSKKDGADCDAVYVRLGRAIYRYRLALGYNQRPLLVSSRGDWIGGPYRGVLYVARRDGLWLLRPRERDIEARLVTSPSAAAWTNLAIAGRVAYVVFGDGRVRGLDVDDQRTVFEARPCRGGAKIGTSARRLYFVCAGPGGKVVAYDRPDPG